MKTQLKADLMILMVTLFWGSSYLFMKMGLGSMQEYNLIALRFGLAFVLSSVVFYRRLMKVNLKTIRNAFILGSMLFAVFASIMFGLKSTSTSNAGFLMSLTVIFVPLMTALFLNKLPEKRVVLGVCLALTGIALLTLKNDLTISHGDSLCILGALLFAAHIIATGQLTKDVDSIALGVLQLGFAGGLGLVFSTVTEIPKLPTTPESWLSVLVLAVLCSAIGFIVQTVAQKYTTPTHTGLIFSLEPVVAAVFAVLFAGETLSTRGYLGAAIVLLGVLNAEVDLKKLVLRNSEAYIGTKN